MGKRRPFSSFLLGLILIVVLVGIPKAIITGFNSPYDVAILPKYNYLYVTNNAANTVSIVNAGTNVIIGTITGFNLPAGISATPNYTFAYVADSGSNELIRITTATNTITGITGGFNQPYFVAISPDGKTAYVTNKGNNTVSIVNLIAPITTLDAGNPSPQSPSIIGGQSIILTANPSGGNLPYSYQWYASLTSTCNSGSAFIGTGSLVSVRPSTSTYYCYTVTDSTLPPNTETSSTTLVTVTAPSKSNGGGSSGGTTGTGGSSPSVPIIVKTSNSCYIVTNLAQLNSLNVSINKVNFKITENYINPNGAGILINGQSYELVVNNTYNISNSTVTVKLANVSYLPIQHTITLQLCSIQQSIAPQVALTYRPVYATAQPEENILSQLNMQNTGVQPQSVILSIGAYPNLLTLATNKTYLNSNQNVSIELMFQSQQNVTPGTYNIPISILSNATSGQKSEQTAYVLFAIQNKSMNKPSYSSQVDLITYSQNYSNTASGIIKINSPRNSSLSNISLRTTMPISIANNISQIVAYGLNNNKTMVNGNYVINWYASYIPSGQSIYAYYTVNKLSNLSSLDLIRDEFVPTTSNQEQNILRLINIIIPIFYANSTGYLTAYVQYKGIVTQRVLFSLTAPSGTTIYNSTQTVNASPNQIINRSFGIKTGTGLKMMILNLSISTAGGNITYTLPINILPPTTVSSSSTVPQQQITTTPNELEIILIIIVIVLIVLILYILENRSNNKSKSITAADAEKKVKTRHELGRNEVARLIKTAKENRKAVNLKDKNLSYADLSRLDLSDAKLSRASLRGANLSKANLERADLSGANLEGANLTDANLAFARLEGANFRKTDLTGVDLSKVDMTGIKD